MIKNQTAMTSPHQPGIYSKAVGSCPVGFGDIQAAPEEIHKVVRLPPEVSWTKNAEKGGIQRCAMVQIHG